MSVVQSISLPTIKNNFPKWRVAFAAAILLLGVAIIAFVLWMATGRVESVQASADGMVYTIAPDISAKLLDLEVQEGGFVEKGQVVAHLENMAASKPVETTTREVYGLNPPTRQEVARRLKEAEIAENNAVQRINVARREEDAKKQKLDNLVLLQAKAELKLRSLDDQSPTNPTYQRYSAEVAAIKKHVEQAKEEFERVSRIRASLDREFQRVHYEIMEAKRLASLNRYAPRTVTQTTTSTNVATNAPSSDLRAPVSGKVLTVSAYPGQTVQKGDPIILILPREPGTDGLWINAWFSEDVAKKLEVGQVCQVEKVGNGEIFAGHIQSISKPSKLPTGEAFKKVKDRNGLFVPVRVAVNAANLQPGDEVVCSLKTKLFW